MGSRGAPKIAHAFVADSLQLWLTLGERLHKRQSGCKLLIFDE
jgi:hypothetical protein